MIFLFLIIIFVVLHLYLYMLFPNYPRVKATDHFDLILVLGCPSLSNGSLSLPQQKRITACIAYCKQGYSDIVVVSGGSIKNEFNEANAISNELQKFLDKTTILIEKEARNTYENLKLCHVLYPDKRILIISSPSHLRRSYFFARKFYSSIAMGCANQRDPWYYYFWEYTRCWVAVYWEIRLKLRSILKKEE